MYTLYAWLNTKLFYKPIPVLLPAANESRFRRKHSLSYKNKVIKFVNIHLHTTSYILTIFNVIYIRIIMVRQKDICSSNQIFNYTFMTVLLDL